MNERESMIIKKQDGTEEKVEVIIVFQFNDNKKEYMVYTKNELDAAGNITIYVSEVLREGEALRLVGVETDDEWLRIKDVLRKLSQKDE